MADTPMQPEAQAFLAAKLAHLRTLAARHGVERPDVVQYAWTQIGGALEALRAVGALSDEEYREWVGRAAEAAGRDRDAAIPGTHAVSTSMQRVAALRQMPGPVQPPRVPPPPPREPAQFVRFVPAPDDERDWFGGRLRFIGVEVYDTEIGVMWRMAPVPDARLAVPEETAALERDLDGLPEGDRRMLVARHGIHPFGLAQRFVISDDAGTEYTVGGGSGGGGDQVQRGVLVARPAPPPQARELRVDALGELFTISLPPA